MKGMGNMQGMMKQVQKMQKDMEKEQEALNKKEFSGKATNDYVKVTATGDRTIKDVQIKEDVIDPEDPEMLQDLIVTAVNDCLENIDKETKQTMGKYTQNIPGM
ncbi:YbaB/EbfC family nucleoid-associated protein [Tetragenococcus halophilus]|uniref:Nucleoid-associated protein C7H83_12265 n=2 Tax=Tetragenococcus halophilus TaxID=51669 RepID=A0A3G5FLF5_TETHA|nr:YbaB/EbfC family nucleoid-associated protein [Tetragenococcus halophilus]AYW51180.1 nucleoid-associated protein, YbaB/EbfC family [Tetragenococcus halophilus]MCF1601324.1 YbaB/EbfC family nucleoid-associated protein [Tetragenococcus halophilus]MCF1683982.1 YbaB/EbfC family nucleoid-associated protein [Tetragenococcus halophilus]MCO7025936.1 YbaB/EbfC family nucleoid-associated protein [Tetragenococcus halophilus]MCO8298484.1 YbaB/EbfC family nucleoid-associated protein [Tetragenococcus halo